jgi:hypothetical protein
MREDAIPFLAAGVGIGVVAVTIAVWAAGGGHGSYLPGKLLFPYTMLIAGGSIGFFGMLLAIVQWPLYGVSLALAAPARRRALALALGVAHMAAALACLALLRQW